MRVVAARLVAHGQPLRVEELDVGEPGDQEVLVQLAFAGVNPIEMRAAQGQVAPDAPVPRTLGTEGAGTVEGRRVMVRGYGVGTTRDGLWATAAIVPRGAVIEVPEGVELPAAAAMGVAGVTAWRCVTDLAEVTAGDTVLVLGASGGVGSIIVSVARGIGATVAAQTGSERNREWLTDRGAHHVVVAGAAGLRDALADLRPTVVFDPLGGDFTGAAIDAMQPHGRMVLFGASAGPDGQVPLRSLYGKSITVRGYAGLLEPDDVLSAATREALAALAAGRLAVPIAAVVPLRQVNDAIEQLARRTVRGKVVLDTSA